MDGFSARLPRLRDEDDPDTLMHTKLIAMVTLGLAALACATTPIIIIKRCVKPKHLRSATTGLGLMLQFGGGILLATTFLHLLPEVREDMENLEKEGVLDDLPLQLPELIMCIGFFLMYAVEELAHVFLHSHATPSQIDNNSHCLEGAAEAAEVAEATAAKHHHHHDHEESKGHSHVVSVGAAPLRGILIIIALSTHQVFEGMAIGLETTMSQVWVLFSAVAAHKLVIAVCVGAEMGSAAVTACTATLCVAVFAIASPAGIALGILLTEADPDSVKMALTSVILQGMATGTLLYVVFFEVLTRSNRPQSNSLLQFLLVVLGFAFMVTLFAFYHE